MVPYAHTALIAFGRGLFEFRDRPTSSYLTAEFKAKMQKTLEGSGTMAAAQFYEITETCWCFIGTFSK